MLNNYQMHHYIHVTMYSVHCTQKCWALWTTSCIINLYQILNKTMIMLEIWKKKMFLLWLPTFCSATTSRRSLDFVVFALTSNASTWFHFPNLLWSKDDPTFCSSTYKIILTTCSMEIVVSENFWQFWIQSAGKSSKINTMIIYLKYKYWSLCSAHNCLLFKLAVPSPRHSLRDLIYLPVNLVLRQNLSSFLFGNLEENKPKCILYLKENKV